MLGIWAFSFITIPSGFSSRRKPNRFRTRSGHSSSISAKPVAIRPSRVFFIRSGWPWVLFVGSTDWSWLKIIAKRIDAGVIPRGDRGHGVSRAPSFTQSVLHSWRTSRMSTSQHLAELTKEEALTYRDGLIIALLAAVPLRRRTLTALTTTQHLVRIGDCLAA